MPEMTVHSSRGGLLADAFYRLKLALLRLRHLLHVLFAKFALKRGEGKSSFGEIRNPFVFGAPIGLGAPALFVGRDDIFGQIDRCLLGEPSKPTPTLLIYGRRRTGKTSVLRNIEGRIDPSLIPVVIDFAEPRYRQSASEFCFSLLEAICAQPALVSPEVSEGSLTADDFLHSPYSKLDGALDALQTALADKGKVLLLAVDNYEMLAGRRVERRLAQDILSFFRHTLEHRRNMALLLAGSRKLDEPGPIHWPNYLVDTRTIGLGPLAHQDALALITEPVPAEGVLDMLYAEGTGEELLRLTACQPYLVQALASALVDLMNGYQRREAMSGDLAVAASNVVVTADGYFSHIWQFECTEEEKEVFIRLSRGEDIFLADSIHHRVLASLIKKEFIDMNDGSIRFKVPLFRLWIEKHEL